MNDAIVNGYIVKVSHLLGMVTVFKQGILVPVEKKSFNDPQDGPLNECYDKAVAFAEAN